MESFMYNSNDYTFEAKTCNQAILKFQRLIGKFPQAAAYSENLIKSARHLENAHEYEDFVQYLANPSKIKVPGAVNQAVVGESIPCQNDLKNIFKGHTLVTSQEQLKHLPNAVYIHVKNKTVKNK